MAIEPGEVIRPAGFTSLKDASRAMWTCGKCGGEMVSFIEKDADAARICLNFECIANLAIEHQKECP